MDFVVALFRALANGSRLRMLAAVHAHEGVTVGSLVTGVELGESVVSEHLRLLTELGLVDARPSGRFVHLYVPQRKAARNPLVRSVNDLLARCWERGSTGNCTPREVCNFVLRDETEPSDGWEAIYDRMVFCFTAYTHLRRLLILRQLAQQGGASQTALANEIGMSPSAVTRHLAKLKRRGIVVKADGKAHANWQLAALSSSSFQGRLHRLVMKALVDK